MIELYTWKTPNGRKASIALEELGLAYAVHPVDISAAQQFDPDYLDLNPNNKIPTIVDEAGVDGRQVVFETGAILLYLADKCDALIPRSGPRRQEVVEWLFWSCSGLAPMLGQWSYFAVRAPMRTPEAIDRFTKEATRLFGVLERRLGEGSYLAGDYSVADISAFTWTTAVLPVFRDKAADAMGTTPNIERWLGEVGARPAVQRGLKGP
jgi:GST-like protein